MRTRLKDSTRLHLALGIGAVLMACALIWIALTAPYGIPLRDRYSLKVEFDDAALLPNHAPVRIAGRMVGQAQRPRAEGGKAVFDLELDPEIAPLRAGTKVRVRPLGLLGQQYLDLIPAPDGAELPDGATIPARDASASVRLPEVLATLDEDRRRALRSIIRTSGAGLSGRGEDLATVLEDGPAALRGLERFARAVTGDGRPPAELVESVAGVSKALDPVRFELAESFAPSARALAPFEERREAVAATLEEAPQTFASLRDRLGPVDALLVALEGLADELEPVLRDAPAGLRETTRLLRTGAGPVGRAERLFEELHEASPAVIDLAGDLRLQVPRVDQQLTYALPSLDELSRRECDLRRFGETWSSMLGFGYEGGGEIGHLGMIRFLVIASPESVGGINLGQPPPGTRSNPYPAPCEAGTELDP